MDSTVSHVDNLMRDVANMSRDIDELKTGLQLSQSELDGLKTSISKCVGGGKTLAERQSAILTSPNGVSANPEYLENQSRRNNEIKVKKTVH